MIIVIKLYKLIKFIIYITNFIFLLIDYQISKVDVGYDNLDCAMFHVGLNIVFGSLSRMISQLSQTKLVLVFPGILEVD